MDDDVAIKVSGVSKKFSRNLKSLMKYGFYDIGRNILGMNVDSGKLRKGEFWALDDISFELKKGDVLGLIGKNGSGKSTMLKMLNGIYMPDRGTFDRFCECSMLHLPTIEEIVLEILFQIKQTPYSFFCWWMGA